MTSALDPELIGEVLRVPRPPLAEEHSYTSLIVTHEIGFARDVADRILFLDGGRIVEEGPPQAILSRPQRARTGEFLGAVVEK